MNNSDADMIDVLDSDDSSGVNGFEKINKIP